MYNFFFHRDTRINLSETARKSGLCARRRRRNSFANAESLETRSLLSAAGNDSPMQSLSAKDLSDRLPPVPADMAMTAAVNLRAAFVLDGVNLTHSADHLLVNRFWEIASSSQLSDDLFASIPPTAPIQLASIAASSFNNLVFGSMSDDTKPTVELRLVETGQLIAVTSGSSIQDSNGLTINDGSSPVIYLRTTDSEGRVQSQLAFVTRTNRQAPISEPQLPITSNGVVIAEGDISDDANSDVPEARPDLHDLETALDPTSNESQSVSPGSRSDASPQSLAAASRTRWVNSTRVSSLNDRDLHSTADARHDVASERTNARHVANDELDIDSKESFAMPIFDPTTRNVVLSVCLLGSLARASSRQRRRLKAAISR